MNTPHNHKDHMKIGRYQSWLEDGKLKLYYHEFGNPSGMYCTMSAEETRGLLELLSRNSEGINEALYVNEKESRNNYAGL
ncbi:hypothetical protein [Dictyobacter aurantiacus]|uniref:Uncharacterized protein n=1 Tax=Dictyobacter aurantiacus TaxID=1936993 RepID=A0A401ZGE9_9CHLR|nr:hypothetical protein [Dictyobacter aurantiacus]GCE05932.1 hypothetical protein KDAU_32610 [Dictyobacter aurantiacus]